MIDQHCVFEIHRLHHEGYSNRAIAEQVGIHRDTVGKYLKNPNPVLKKRKKKASKLDGFTERIDQMLSEYPGASAVVILQKLKEMGFTGEVSMVRKYLQKKRGKVKNRQPFVRFESQPGQQMQVDWGHFGSLDYQGDGRKLYGLVVIESWSRMMYVEFTHSQKQESLHQCLFNAFRFFGGTPKELVVDNMTTAVIERQSKVIRFNDQFLQFLRPLRIMPRACNIRAAYEKGKVERSIGYLRKNFLPLRHFDNLTDIQQQVLDWLDKTANKRIHQTTGVAPVVRAGQLNLTSLPSGISEHYPEIVTVKVYKDFSIRFDANSYTTPPWCIGKQLTVKADQKTVRLYHRERLMATHPRCWRRKQRIEHPRHVEEAKKLQHRALESTEENLFKSLGEEFREFLSRLAKSSQPIQKNLERILNLKDQYGKGSLSWAIQKALRHNAIGADYIENILYQEMTPETEHLPVKVKRESLNQIRLSEPNLAEYDAFILKRRQNMEMNAVIEKCKRLSLDAFANHLEQTLEQSKSNNWSFLKMLDDLLEREVERRTQNRIALRFKQSKLGEKITIDQFDFKHHTSRKENKNRILSLMSQEFIRQKTDVILIGNPGVGKSFLAKCIAYTATQAQVKVLFTTAMDMINQLVAADADKSLLKKLNIYQSPDLLVVDELGYLPLGTQGSNLFFQVISARHAKKSTVITTNLPFANWANIFDSTTVATAIADRLVYNSEVLVMKGESYRKRAT